jgi:LacI family transcriptional regulator
MADHGKKVCLKDIAEKVGVSTALVSYVLNNKKEGRISKDVAEKIREAARLMNYRPNQIAKSLKTNRTDTIGMIVADISNPYFSSLARIIEDEADKRNYTVIIGSSDENPDKFAKLIETFTGRNVDGLLIAATAGTEDQLRQLQEQKVPFVLVDRYFPGLTSNYVGLDNYNASWKAVQHLAEKGRQRIGLITYESQLFHINERKRGFLEACKYFGISARRHMIRQVGIKSYSAEIIAATKELLSSDPAPDALLFASNRIAEHAVKYINTLSLKVPDQLALVSFDETECLDLFYAPLTYLRQPLKEMGKEATRILLDGLDSSVRVTQVNMEAELVVRQSTGTI